MTLETIYYIGQTIAVFALVASLIFVGVQIRDNSRAVKDQNRWNRIAEVNETARSLIANPELLRANTEAASPEWKAFIQELAEAWGVSFEDATAVMWTQSTFVYLHWGQWRAMKTKRDEVELKTVVKAWYSAEPMKSDFKHPVTRAIVDPEFVDWIDGVLEELDDASGGSTP